jgi:tyrosyl-tRNA synthetase
MTDFITELTWRKQIHNTTPNIADQLKKESTSGYIGFDPTASSLHIGNLATLMLLVHFQRAGHRPIALVGGATGMVGDPSGKSEERNFLDEATLRFNQDGIRSQLEKFLDFNVKSNPAKIVNNYDWFKNIGFLQFLRETGKHLTVNYMMSKDSVKKRLETGISFTEFSYQLLQAYDYLHLYKTEGCKVQMGGSDQWGNITSGTELIRRIDGGEAYALTCPLVTRSDGSKFGKSATGENVWLDATKTSPYKFYQFWLNVRDEDLPTLLRVFTLFDENTITELEQNSNPNVAKKALAEEVTTRVHSITETEKAAAASEILFGKGTVETLQNTDETTLMEVFEGVPHIKIHESIWHETANCVDLLSTVTASKIFSSKGEARKMIDAGGVSINKQKITLQDHQFELLKGKYLLVQKGKKNYFLVEIIK